MLRKTSMTQNAWSFALHRMNSRYSWTILDVYFGTDDVVIEECYQCERTITGKSDALPQFRQRELSGSPLQLAFTMNTLTPCKYSGNRRPKGAEPESQSTYNSTTVYERNFNRKKLPPMESNDKCPPVVPPVESNDRRPPVVSVRHADSGCRGEVDKGKPMVPKSPDYLCPNAGSRRASEDITRGRTAGIPELLDITMINDSCNKVTTAARGPGIEEGTLRVDSNQLLPVVKSKTPTTSNQLLPGVTSTTSATQEASQLSPPQRKRSIMKKRIFLREEYFNVNTDAFSRRRMSVSWADGMNNNLESVYHVETLHPSPRQRTCSLPMIHQLILPIISRRCTHVFS